MKKLFLFLLIALASSIVGYHLVPILEEVIYGSFDDDMLNQYYSYDRKLDCLPVRVDSINNHFAQSVETSYLKGNRNLKIDSTRVIMCGEVYNSNIVYDAATALTIAQAVWIPIYGEKWVESHYPYLVKEYDEVYQVVVPKQSLPNVAIRKLDGKILSLNTHLK